MLAFYPAGIGGIVSQVRGNGRN